MTYVERCLYDYKANIAALEAMQADINSLVSVHGLDYKIRVNGINNPVESVLDYKMALEKKITNVERKIKPVKKLYADLCGSDLKIVQMREILELKYINHESNYHTQRKMAVSERTFWRRVRELLYMAKKYFGE